MRFVAATRNLAKVAELQRSLDGLARIEPIPRDISLESSILERLEDGDDCAEIARSKAIAWSKAINGAMVVATDGGLLIPGLGSAWNPTRTRRFASEVATDLQRAERLLQLAAGLTVNERQIGWIESVAITESGQLLAEWSAESSPGLLAETVDRETINASLGFWIDSVWKFPQFGNRLRRQLRADELAGVADHWSVLGPALRSWISVRAPGNG